VLPSIIALEQSAFINDRVIMDNVLIAQEILHLIGNKSEGKKLMAIKIDMERACDMRWDFLKATMGRFGFADKFIEMVMGCICEPSFAILVNGSPTSWFQLTMGLRQGDSLSPYLFVLGAELLTRLRKIEQGRGRLGILIGQCTMIRWPSIIC